MKETKARRTFTIIAAIGLPIALGMIYAVTRPGDGSASCGAFYAGMANPPAPARDWCSSGSYFTWESTLAGNAGYGPLQIFHVCQGDRANPAILLVHGYPTSSFDFALLMDNLSTDYYVCALDTPGYGFSDKPRQGFDYSIFDDARLVDAYIREVAELDEFVLLTHDKGDSVGLALLQIYQSYAERPYTITQHVITNGNIYLPLAQLHVGQRALLDPTTGPAVALVLTGDRFANGLAESAYASALSQVEVESLASIFDYQDGTRLQHEIIQYLDERAEHEVTWLETLAASEIPTTLIWGEQDEIAPPAVPDFVWETALENRETPASDWRIPCADHYLQVDKPAMVADIVRATQTGDDVPATIAGDNCHAVQLVTNE